MDRHEIVAALEEIAVLLELLGENPFKTRAYQSGARALEQLDEDLGELIRSGRLADLKGFGPALVEKISTLHATGSLPYLDDLRARLPSGLMELLAVPGVGPKKVRLLHEKLGIASLGELEYACIENRLLGLPGFGEKSQAKILAGIAFVKKNRDRRLYSEVLPVAEQILERLRAAPGVARAELAGLLRRRRETVKDIDLLAVAGDGLAVGRVLTEMPGVASITGHGTTKTSVRLTNGLAVDLRVVTPEQFGAALVHFTGNKDWNTALRARAKERGLKLNEYGLFAVDAPEDAAPVVECRDEAAVLTALGLPDVPPELREDESVVEAAARGEIPVLVQESDIRGVLHVHTTYSDGADPLGAMVAAAEALGHEYVGITDHSQTAVYAHGMKADDVRRQHDEIDDLQARHPRIRILKGVESDILADGSLDYPDDVLAGFDFVIASVHSQFGLAPADMTQRLVVAVSHPATRVLGHPTGRLLLAREGFAFDLGTVLEACARNGVAIELNAHPHRLDLDWRNCRLATRLGVKVSINPDSHRAADLTDVRYGVGIARKGWLRPTDVLNTMGAAEMTAHLRRAGA